MLTPRDGNRQKIAYGNKSGCRRHAWPVLTELAGIFHKRRHETHRLPGPAKLAPPVPRIGLDHSLREGTGALLYCFLRNHRRPKAEGPEHTGRIGSESLATRRPMGGCLPMPLIEKALPIFNRGKAKPWQPAWVSRTLLPDRLCRVFSHLIWQVFTFLRTVRSTAGISRKKDLRLAELHPKVLSE